MAKKSKTVKELDTDVKKLLNIVESLKKELKETKYTLNSKIKGLENKLITNIPKERTTPTANVKDRIIKKNCMKCDFTGNTYGEIKNHIIEKHPQKFQYKHCDLSFDKRSDLEEHISAQHEITESYKCTECDKTFILKWRLRKHTEIHKSKSKYCHFFNNDKVCLFEKIGCTFKHDRSPQCKFGDKCNRNLCQYSHNKGGINILHPVEKFIDEESEDEIEDDIYLNQNCNELDDFMCEKYCSNGQTDGKKYHVCPKEKYCELKGFDVKNIRKNDFPCNVCDFRTDEKDKLHNHINQRHPNYVHTLGCLCENCGYNVDDPEEMIEHLKNVHIGMMKKLVQAYILTK